MLRRLLGPLLGAALAVSMGVALIFAVTVGAVILPRGDGVGDRVASVAWALLTAAVLGIGGTALLIRFLRGPAAAARPPAAGVEIRAFAWRAHGRCPVCRTSGARRDIAWCDRCLTPHHDDCWRYVGKCAVFGCGGTVPRTAEVVRSR